MLQQGVPDESATEAGRDGQRDESNRIHAVLAGYDSADHGIAEDPRQIDDPDDFADRAGHRGALSRRDRHAPVDHNAHAMRTG